MPRVIGQPKYVQLREKGGGDLLVDVGDVLIDKGKLIGMPPSRRYGTPEYDFILLESGKNLRLGSSRAIQYMVEQGQIGVGDVLTVLYDGLIEIEKGPMAGRECHTFKVELWENEELAELGLNPNKIKTTKGNAVEEDDEDEEPAPRRRKKAKAVEDEEEEEDEEPAPRRRRGRPKPEPEEVEEDDEEEAPPPKKKKKKTTSKKKTAKKTTKRSVSEEEDEEEDDDDLDLDDLE